jgi:hypothetical protein
LGVGLLRELLEKADDVAVFKADNGDTHRGCLSEGMWGKKREDDGGDERSNGEPPEGHTFMLLP